MQRVLTAAVAIPLALAAIFWLPSTAFFALLVILFELCAWEYLALVRPRAPEAPLRLLLILVPLAAAGLALALSGRVETTPYHLLAAGVVLAVAIPTALLFGRVPLDQSLAALGILGFGVPYFALPIATLHQLQQTDPWLVFLVCAIVWVGDSAAYYLGSRWGKHRLAPVISPKKSWEGAVAGLLAGVLSAAVWSWFRLGTVDPRLLFIGVATAIAAQIGDLVESMIKRQGGVKDSGTLLPGHGGFFDRMDAMLFAAPVLLVAAWLMDFEVLAP